MAVERKPIDWRGCEDDYRTGVLSIRALAAKYGCAESAIRDRAKRYGWSRDLTKAVRSETNARLLRSELRTRNAGDDERIVGAAADLRVALVTSHRRDLEQLHGLKRIIATRLAAHLNGEQPDGPFLGDKESPGDLLEKLSRVTSRLIPLERQAHNMDEAERDPSDAMNHDGSAIDVLTRRIARLSARGGPPSGDEGADEGSS